jgi:predicted Zn-dependent peptidase
VEEVLDRLDAVTGDQVQTMAQKLFVSERIAVTLLGRLDGLKLRRSNLIC